MLLSMTGFGEAHRRRDALSVAVEARTINGRYFKLTLRASEGYAAFEAPLEQVVRRYVRRGTVQVGLRIDRLATADDYRVNQEVLLGYHRQLERLRASLGLADLPRWDALLALPGVVEEQAGRVGDLESVWPVVEEAAIEALERLAHMRVEEGRAMAADLAQNNEAIAARLAEIERRAPLVVDAYSQRLTDRLNALLAQHELKVEAADVVREVAMFAERCDIAEEVVRLKSHLAQFDAIMRDEEGAGKKLEFLTQEMFREANTIGSKANDAEIARLVIDCKTAIERIREMIQNVE